MCSGCLGWVCLWCKIFCGGTFCGSVERERERESTNTSRPFRVLVLSEGEVVESGRPWELLSNKESHFHSIFQSQ